MRRTLIAAALMLAYPAAAQVARPVAAAMAEADALKASGDDKGALERAKAALVIAEAERPANRRSVYEALDHLTGFWPAGDLEGQFALFDRLAPMGATIEGADSYRPLALLAGRNVLAFFLGKPGASLDAVAVPLARSAPLARGDKERMDTAALGIMLAQFYTNAGQRAKAVDILAVASKLFETAPAKPLSTYPGGLTTLAQIHAGWGDWDTSLRYADRAIVAHDAFDTRRTVNAAAPLIHRGNALRTMQRFPEAEVALRQALALADAVPDPFIKVSALQALGTFYAATGRDALAVPLITRAADLAVGFPPGAGSRVAALNDLHGLAIRRGDFAEALRLMRQARADVEKRNFRGSLNHAAVLMALANAATATGALDEARSALAEAAPMVEKSERAGGQRRAELAMARGRLALREGRLGEGDALMGGGLALTLGQQAPDQTLVYSANIALAQAQLGAGNRAAAWARGRSGADVLTRLIVRRSGAAGASTQIVGQEARAFDTAIDVAWALGGSSR
jgi:tetratricopeptide (TPR) repeat protein